MLQYNTGLNLYTDGVDVTSGNGNQVLGNTLTTVTGTALEVSAPATNTTVTGNLAANVRTGVCDDGTGTTPVPNTIWNEQFPATSPCPVDD